MTRPIKFRAWDKTLGEMMDVHELGFNDKGKLVSTRFGDSKGSISIYDSHQLVKKISIMQFTGLLDKNGKEIYEGDIADIGEHERPRIMECIYKAPYFYWKNDKENDSYSGAWGGGETEVVGNIYENPSLLPTPVGDKQEKV